MMVVTVALALHLPHWRPAADVSLTQRYETSLLRTLGLGVCPPARPPPLMLAD